MRRLADHRDALGTERTRAINRLRWHLHELAPAWAPARGLWRPKRLSEILDHLAKRNRNRRQARSWLVERCRLLSVEILELDAELEQLVAGLAPSLLSVCGCATLTAAKTLGETADVRRFLSRHAYARHNGTATLPVWSRNNEPHRLARTGNRRLNAAIRRIAITQATTTPTPRPSSNDDELPATPRPNPSESASAPVRRRPQGTHERCPRVIPDHAFAA